MEWNIVVGAACAILGAVLSYAGFARSKAKDDKHEGQQDGLIIAELGYIKGSIDTLNKKIDRQDERTLEMISRLTAVEASAKQAHHRIDRMEEREDRQ